MSDERRTVLVVDDDPDILEIVTVVLDLMMPRMNGVDVIAAMKRDPALATMPVVVISGNYHTEQAVLAMGADEYLLKPIDVDVLLHAVSRFVRVGRRSQEAADDGQRC